MNIYVGNLAHAASEDDVRKAFEEFGQVDSVKIILDKFTNQSRGFGFVEMPNNTEAQAAVEGLNSKDLMGRSLRVNEAHAKRDDRRRGGGGFGGGGGGGYGRGGFGGGGGRDRY
jgi:RNA recognition motif-containing protein